MIDREEIKNAIGGYLEGAWPTDSEEHAKLVLYIDSLLADREALVRYVRANRMCRKSDQRTHEGIGWFREWQNSWQALSQELKDEIQNQDQAARSHTR